MLLPRGPLMLSPRLMLTTDTTDAVMDMVDMDMLLMDALPMPMVHTHVPMDTMDMDMVVKPHKTNKRNHSD